MGLVTDEQEKAANDTLRRLDRMLEEHGCEMAQASNIFQWIIIKGDRVLMRIRRAQVNLARLEETRAIVEEVVRREAASADDALEMLDKARTSENHTSVLLDVTRRERDELNEVVKALRAKMEELAIWKSHRLDCDQRAHDYDLDAGECRHCHVQLSDEDWTVMREATGRAAPSELARTVERTVRMAADRGFINKQVEKRKEVGRLEDIAGGPSERSVGADFAIQRFMHGVGADVEDSSRHGCLSCDPCKECSCDPPTWRGVPIISDDSLPGGKIYAVPKDPSLVPAGHEWKVLTPPKPTVVADPPFSYQQEFREAVRVLPAGRHLLEAGQRFVVDGNVLGPVMTTPQRGLWDVWVRNGSTCTALYEDKEG
jgi:hypothetical protein